MRLAASMPPRKSSSAFVNNLCICAWSGCNAYYDIGSRTQWNVTKDFYLGVDVMYGTSEHGVGRIY
jgi:hypothetical protein